MRTIASKILRDLSAGPSCADSIGERIKVKTFRVDQELYKLKERGKVESKQLPTEPDLLIVWRLK